jgi:hypothetical protein
MEKPVLLQAFWTVDFLHPLGQMPLAVLVLGAAQGADPKSVQGQMRHCRISTTMDCSSFESALGHRIGTENVHNSFPVSQL